jgi:hypothetical protein
VLAIYDSRLQHGSHDFVKHKEAMNKEIVEPMKVRIAAALLLKNLGNSKNMSVMWMRKSK